MSNEKDISILDIVIQILSNIKFVIYIFIFFILIWLAFILFTPAKYTSTSKVVADVSNKDNYSISKSLSTLRSLGLNLGPSGVGLIPETYPKILKSNDVLYSVIHKKFYFKDIDSTITYLAYIKRKNFFYYLKKFTIGLPNTIAKIFRNQKNLQALKDSTGQILYLTKYEFKAINRLRNKLLSINTDENTGIITINITTNDPVLSANINKELILSFRKQIQKIYAHRTKNNLDFIRKQLKQAKTRLEKSTNTLIKFMERNSNPTTIALKMQMERLKNELDFNRQFYNELKTQYTQTEIELKKKEPIITVIEHPTPPTIESGMSKLGLLLLFIFMAIIVILIKASYDILINNIKNDRNNLDKIKKIRNLIIKSEKKA